MSKVINQPMPAPRKIQQEVCFLDRLRAEGGKEALKRIDAHEARKDNPHKVTTAQINAASAADLIEIKQRLDTHEARTDNPHKTTAAQIGAVAAREGAKNIWVRATHPIAKKINDIWLNTSTGKWYFWTGNYWTQKILRNKLYHCDNNLDKNYELDPNNLAVISSAASPSSWPYGIGGIK